MWSINNEFGRGFDLNAYRGTQYWRDDGSTGYFSTGQITIGDFYGTRATNPVPNPGCYAIVGGSGSGSVYTTSQSDCGPEHPQRIVVVAVGSGDTTASPVSSMTINGVGMSLGARSSGSGSMRLVAVYYLALPSPRYCDLRVVFPGAASGCVFGCYGFYPSNSAMVDSGAGSTTATSAGSGALVSAAGGYYVGVSHHRNTNGTNWAGTMGLGYEVNYNSTYGGTNVSISWARTTGASGTSVASWAGSNNGSMACALFNA